MRQRVATTQMYYQVESSNGVHESMCYSLAEAQKLVRALQDRGVAGLQIARYDRSDYSDYYEIIET